MAAPVVACLAALIKSRFPSLSPAQIKQRIVDGCMNIDHLNSGFEGQLGAGRINALASLAVTSVTDTEQDGAIALYPNPATIGETIRFIGFSSGDVSLEMTDMTGRTVVSEVVTDGRFQLPTSVPSGMYALRVKGQSGTSVMRLLVQ
jgi:subtilisin family serine protease